MYLLVDVWANTDGPLSFTCFGGHRKYLIGWAIMPWFQGSGRCLCKKKTYTGCNLDRLLHSLSKVVVGRNVRRMGQGIKLTGVLCFRDLKIDWVKPHLEWILGYPAMWCWLPKLAREILAVSKRLLTVSCTVLQYKCLSLGLCESHSPNGRHLYCETVDTFARTRDPRVSYCITFRLPCGCWCFVASVYAPKDT